MKRTLRPVKLCGGRVICFQILCSSKCKIIFNRNSLGSSRYSKHYPLITLVFCIFLYLFLQNREAAYFAGSDQSSCPLNHDSGVLNYDEYFASRGQRTSLTAKSVIEGIQSMRFSEFSFSSLTYSIRTLALNQSVAQPLLRRRDIPTPFAPSIPRSQNLPHPPPKTPNVLTTHDDFDPFADMDEALLNLDVEGRLIYSIAELTVMQHWPILIAKVSLLPQPLQPQFSHIIKDLSLTTHKIFLRENFGHPFHLRTSMEPITHLRLSIPIRWCMMIASAR
jgi:hypothetical protein